MNEIVNHDSTGRFATGNKASAGRQRPDARTARSKGAELRRAWSDAIGPSDIERIKSTLITIAHDPTHPKCVDACKLILERLFGKPRVVISADVDITARQDRDDDEQRRMNRLILTDDTARHLSADLSRRLAEIESRGETMLDDDQACELADNLARRLSEIPDDAN